MVARGRIASAMVTAVLVSFGLGAALASSAPATAAALEPVGPGLVTAGSSHTCAVSAAGAATCWGSGAQGRLGTSLSDDSGVPAPVFGWQAGVQAIEAGNDVTCGVIDDGVKCWGSGEHLGRGTTRHYGAPVAVTGMEDGVTSLSVGQHSVCAVKDGSVFCWGDGAKGLLGNGSTDDELLPVEVAGLPGAVGSVSVGSEHTCAVTEDGAAWCWGSNVGGQLGNGTTTDSLVPVEVAGLAGVRQVAAGFRHTCATTWDGDVRCWGANTNGQLGIGSTSPSLTPTAVAFGADVKAIEASNSNTCAIDGDRRLWCWGANAGGQIGDYSTTEARSPVAVTAMPSVARVAVGGQHTCAVATDGELRCWGSNSSGQLGRATPATTAVQPVLGLGSGVTAIDGGNAHTCAVAGGAARCWGDNASGQLGVVGPTVSGVPVGVTGLTSGVTAISAGTSFSCAVVDGAAKCWGLNTNGQLGNGTTTSSTTPVAVTGMGSGVTAISAGTSHACAVKDGGVWCWGLGTSGQLGDDGTTSSNVPVENSAVTSDATEVAADATASCTIRAGAVTCWGTGGATGGGAAVHPVPALVSNMNTGSSSLAAGAFHSCAINASGGARCWGSGTMWQLGTSTNSVVTTPVTPIGQTSGVTRLAAAANKTCSVKSSAVYCWGNSPLILNTGQPTLIAGLSTSVTEVTVGNSHQCAIKDGGALCWGTNAKGELGNGLYGPTAGISLDPPTVLDQPTSAAAVAGSTVSFTAAASGSPAPSVQWERSDDAGDTWQAVADATAPTLTFTAELPDDGARFRAVFENELGTVTTEAATLTVGGAIAGAPGTPTARAGSGEAVVSWSAPSDDGGSPITGYRVTPYVGSEAQDPIVLTGPATSRTITGLADGQLHRFAVSALNAAGAGADSVPSNEVWVHPGLPQASISDVRVLEGAGVAEVEVVLSKPATLTARVRTSPGTATAGDFTAIDEQVEFLASGPTTATVSIPIAADTVKELTETFTTTLTAPNSKAVLADGSGTVRVVDDDGLPAQISVGDVSSAAEGTDAVFPVVIRGVIDADVSVPYETVAGTATTDDYSATSGTLTFTAGEVDPVRTIAVPIADDAIAEGVEHLTLKITPTATLTAADTSARASIPANDGGTGALPAAPRISIDDLRATEGTAPATAVVRIDQSATASVVLTTTAGTATAGDDYAATTTTVTFTAGGPTAVEVPLPLVDDASPEPDEKLTHTLKSATGATIADSSGTVTLLDDDGLPPQVRISDAFAREGNDAFFLVSLVGSSDRDVTVDLTLTSGTATAGSDFGSLDTTSITFPAGGMAVRVIRVPITSDGLAEPGSETFTVKLLAAAGSVATIVDGTGKASITD